MPPRRLFDLGIGNFGSGGMSFGDRPSFGVGGELNPQFNATEGMNFVGQGTNMASAPRRLNPFQQYGKAWNSASTLGKVGMGLGTAGLAMGLASGLKGIFGGRQGPTREEIEQEALARSGMGLADQFGGEMSSMGMGLQNDGRSMLERGRSRYLSTMFDPSVLNNQRAQIASDLAAARRSAMAMPGVMQGGLSSARSLRQIDQFNPNAANALVQATNANIGRQARGAQYMANAGQQDFNQGLGLRNQGYGIASQGRQNLTSTLGRLDAARQQRRMASQQAIGGLFKTAGTAASGGLF